MHAAAEPLLTVADLAARFRVSGEHIRRRIRSGELPAIDVSKPGGGRPAYRIPASAVDAFFKNAAPPSGGAA